MDVWIKGLNYLRVKEIKNISKEICDEQWWKQFRFGRAGISN